MVGCEVKIEFWLNCLINIIFCCVGIIKYL